MKKLLLILLCLPFIGFGQQTYVPDDNFEAYLEANGMGNGVANDDYVTTANIDTVTILDVDNQNIIDLTGIEDFSALMVLECRDNQLTSLNITQNTALVWLLCAGNFLTNLDVSQNIDLGFLEIGIVEATGSGYWGGLHNQLTSLDVSNNINLEFLDCSNNQITCLDVSNNINLTEIACNNNALEQLYLNNLDLSNITFLYTHFNPSLNCIQVDNASYATSQAQSISDWLIENFTTFSTNCNYANPCNSTTAIQEHTTNKELLKVTDLLGRETKSTNQPLFYIYDDGTVEKRIVIK